jgi:hypothetical protein
VARCRSSRALSRNAAGLGDLNHHFLFAAQKFNIEFLFGFLNLIRDRRRRDDYSLGRTRDVLLLVESNKMPGVPEFNVCHRSTQNLIECDPKGRVY